MNCFGFELEERVDIGPKEEKSKMMEIVVGRQTPRLAKTFLQTKFQKMWETTLNFKCDIVVKVWIDPWLAVE